MDKEKILYHAKHNGSFTIRSCEYQGNLMDNLDYLIKNKMIIWETNNLWSDYEHHGQQHLYDDALHSYKITKDGEVLLAIYRMAYAHKNHNGEEKHLRRIDEFFQLLEESTRSTEFFNRYISKNQKKAVQYAVTLRELPEVDFIEPVLDNSTHLDPYKIKHVHLGISKDRIEAIELDEPVLKSMFNMSVGLGWRGTDASRTEDYVLRKVNEELGELTLEMNIRDGLSYKEAGKDGVKGEAVDLAICALDMFALQCDGMSAEEMEREFLTYMLVKLNKWRNSIK